MCYVRGQKRDFNAWYATSDRDENWFYDNLWKIFIEQKNDIFHNEHHGIDGNLSVEVSHTINELNRICLKVALKLLEYWQEKIEMIFFKKRVNLLDLLDNVSVNDKDVWRVVEEKEGCMVRVFVTLPDWLYRFITAN